jgi:hypothetical protein
MGFKAENAKTPAAGCAGRRFARLATSGCGYWTVKLVVALPEIPLIVPSAFTW